jgi:hypothetical protein
MFLIFPSLYKFTQKLGIYIEWSVFPQVFQDFGTILLNLHLCIIVF